MRAFLLLLLLTCGLDANNFVLAKEDKVNGNDDFAVLVLFNKGEEPKKGFCNEGEVSLIRDEFYRQFDIGDAKAKEEQEEKEKKEQEKEEKEKLKEKEKMEKDKGKRRERQLQLRGDHSSSLVERELYNCNAVCDHFASGTCYLV